VRDPRLRLAQQLQMSGSDTSPVGHWTQGLARLAQALAGNRMEDRADTEYRGQAEAYQNDMRGFMAPIMEQGTAGPGPRQGPGGATMRPATFAELSERAGRFSSPYAMEAARPLMQQAMQQEAAAAARGTYSPVKDDAGNVIGQRNSASGKIDYVPAGMLDQWEPAAGPGGLQGQRNRRTNEWKPADTRPQTTVNTNVTPQVNIPGEDSFSKGLGTATVEAIQGARTQAQSGLGTIQATRRIQDLLDSGVITGTGAELRLSLNRALATAGLIDGKRVTNTEQLLAEISNNVLARTEQMKGVLTDRDIEFLKDAAAGRISLTPETIRRVAEISERGSGQLVENYNSMVRPLEGMQNVPQAARNVFRVMDVPARQTPGRQQPAQQGGGSTGMKLLGIEPGAP